MSTRLLRSLVILSVVAWAGIASANLSASNVAFGTVPIADPAAVVVEAVSGDQVAGELLDHITVTGTGCTVVTAVPDPPEVLPRLITTLSSMPIRVSFDPTTRVAVTCTVTLFDSADASLGTFTVTGDGSAPEISVPVSTAFGEARVTNGATTNADVVIQNVGELPLSISALSTTGDFALTTAATFPIVVAASGSVGINVTFDPTASGARTGDLVITSDDPVSNMKNAPLAGTGTNAVISVNDVNFGAVTNNTTAAQDITVTNLGAAPVGQLHVASATIAGGSWFTFGDNGAGCAGLTTCTFAGIDITTTAPVSVQCSPAPLTASGMQIAMVTFTHDGDSGGDAVAMLTCVAGRPNIVVDQSSLAFGNVGVGTTSATQTVTVSNTGNRDITFTANTVGGFAARYTLGGTCSSGCTVVPAGNTSFTVAYTPDARAQQDITIELDTNDPDPGDDPFVITVTGHGIAPLISGPANVTFGNVEVGKTSGTQALTITNTGDATLTISSAVVQAGGTDYTAVGTSGTQMVAPSATASWDVTCAPQGQGSRPGNFRILSDALGANTLDVPLACTGTRGFLTVTPTTHDFAGVAETTTVTFDVTLANTGNLPVTGITAVVDPATAGYTVVAATLPSMLAASGGAAQVTIQFAPTATADGGPATVTFSGVWGTTSTATLAVLGLDGNGLSTGYDVSRSTIPFGDFRYDTLPTQTFCITNTSEAPVTINSPISVVPGAGTASNEFAIAGIVKQATCGIGGAAVSLPQTLAATEVLEVTVRAQPANRLGALAADLVITSDLGITKLVALSGNSISAMLTLVPGSTLNFGVIDLQASPPSATATVRLRNTGAAPLDLGNFARSANPAFSFTLPADSTVAPAAEISFDVTYAPTVAMATDEIVTITHSIAGDFALPALGTITLRGRGIDRDLQIVGALPVFPDTFRNPGIDGPVRLVSVQNSGEAPLAISGVMVTNDPDVWTLLDPDPITIPGGATFDFRVRFQPKIAGRSEARLQLVNDDDDDGPPITTKITEIDLTGNGIDRRVSFNPTIVNLGYIEVGRTARLPDALIVTSMDDTNMFTIKSIQIDGADNQFAVIGAENISLPPSAERRFDVSFTPREAGEFTAMARLYLDLDPEHQAEIEVRGTAVFVDARGGGGCSTGGGVGGGAIALVLLVLARRRRALAVGVVIAGLAFAPVAEAEDDILLSVFDPTPATTTDGFQLQSPVVGKHGAWAAAAVFSYASDPLLHVASAGGDQGVVTGSSMLELGGAIALFDRFELGARMPFYSQSGEAFGDPQTEYTAQPADGTATGDLTLHGKVKLYDRILAGGGSVVLGASLQVTVPTATDGMLTGVDGPSARILALAALVPGAFSNRVTVSANAGAIARSNASYENLHQKSGVAWGLGTSVRVLDPLWLAAEMFGEFVPSGRQEMDGSTVTLSPIEWLGGVRWRPSQRFTVSLAAGRGLTSAAGTPALRGVLAVTFTPLADKLRPIHAPLPLPPDVDSDGDGIFDREDKCADDAEDRDLFEDSDGCPDLDNDGDGVPDATDRCPLDAEDKDGFEDDDGCPDKDNDADSVLDEVDRCPDEPEDKDGFEDLDGCPELDNDADGVPDALDKCPTEREIINGNQDDDGCPDQGIALVVLSPDRIELLDTIQFQGIKLSKNSYNLMGQIAATLRAHPEVLRIRVSVHVQAGKDEAKDQELSDKRAAALRDWLVQWGIAADRVDTRGFGSSKPLGGSSTVNERVELVIMEKK